MSELTLYSYWRSSSAWRVRLVLELKGIKYNYEAVHLVKNGGEQRSSEYAEKNPFQLVPCLTVGKIDLTESAAIVEYLEEAFPDVPLLPKDSLARAQVRSICSAIACNIQPIQNLKVLQRISEPDGALEKKVEWANYWITSGFVALEKKLSSTHGKCCFGDDVTLADCFLVPQVYNAVRWKVDMSKFPIISAINAHCESLASFVRAHPDQQPDAEKA